MKEKAVGIVANPASGKDIRRIVTYSTPYGNQEKGKYYPPRFDGAPRNRHSQGLLYAGVL